MPSLPDGHLPVVWDDRVGDSPERARNALGTAVLLALLAIAVTAVRRQPPRVVLQEPGM